MRPFRAAFDGQGGRERAASNRPRPKRPLKAASARSSRPAPRAPSPPCGRARTRRGRAFRRRAKAGAPGALRAARPPASRSTSVPASGTAPESELLMSHSWGQATPITRPIFPSSGWSASISGQTFNVLHEWLRIDCRDHPAGRDGRCESVRRPSIEPSQLVSHRGGGAVSTRDFERVATHCAPAFTVKRDGPRRGIRGSPSPLRCPSHPGK